MKYSSDKYKYISTLDGETVGGKTYMVDCNDNGLYVLDEISGIIQFLDHLGRTEKNIVAEFSFILFREGKIYVLPQNSYFIVVYNVKTNEIQNLNLPYNDEEEYGFNAIGWFWSEKWLYVFSCMKKFPPFRLNIDSLHIEVIYDLWEALQLLPQLDESYYMEAFVRDGNNIYFGLYNTNRLYVWSVQRRELNEILQLKKDFHIKLLVKCGERELLVSSVQSNVFARVDLSSKLVKYHKIDNWNSNVEIVRMLVGEEYTWLLPRFGSRVIRYDYMNDSFCELLYDHKVLPADKQEHERIFWGCSECSGRLFLYRHGSNGRLVINIKTGETVFQMLDKDKNKKWQEIVKENFWRYVDVASFEADGVINEGLYNLPLFLQRVSRNEKSDSLLLNRCSNMGRNEGKRNGIGGFRQI